MSPDSPSGDRFVWPHCLGLGKQSFLCGPDIRSDKKNIAPILVPLDFFEHGGRHLHSTLSHELGHTLGLPDMYAFPSYSTDVRGRITSGREMMAGSTNMLQHYSIASKMNMGWIQPTHVKLFDIRGTGGYNQNVTLRASELDDPAPGGSEFKAIEFRLGDGWNYYVEYRARQASQTTDAFADNGRVMVTDVISEGSTFPISRPLVLFVHDDVDGDGRLIDVGQDFEERQPPTALDLAVTVVSKTSTRAVVHVSYGSNGRPDPGIRKWNGAATHWQSPDIEVRNDRSRADPGRFTNFPWLGHENTVVAKIKNGGDLAARGVVADFFVTEYSAGDGPWVPLGSATRDIPGGATVEFSASWFPPNVNGRHYCIIVQIRHYKDPANPAIEETNIFNNEARSNYVRFISSSGTAFSPPSLVAGAAAAAAAAVAPTASTRVGTAVQIANPFPAATTVYANVSQTHASHRVFTEATWVRLAGGARMPIRVWDEAIYGTAEWGRSPNRSEKDLWAEPNHVSLVGLAVPPFKAGGQDCKTPVVTGGVGMRVDAGRGTAVEIASLTDKLVEGRVVYIDDGARPPVTGVRGKVLVEVFFKDAGTGPGKTIVLTTNLGEDGRFLLRFDRFPTGKKLESVTVYYLGALGAAASELHKVVSIIA
ncbi:hypothetical protein BKA56DRAFT_606199 [Ilyonectria sp. MPI-CAGE-AT-0026]|nr:hypothetical protein BKA56DRAFT_606199 [Ilyonectria sp. MPI-CAGE-AT-0026]